MKFSTRVSKSFQLIIIIGTLLGLAAQVPPNESFQEVDFLSPVLDNELNFTKRTYEGYTVLRFQPYNLDQLHALQNLADKWPEVDLWSPPSVVNSTIDVMVPPQSKSQIIDHFSKIGLHHTVLIEDVESLISTKDTTPAGLLYRAPLRQSGPRGFFSDYQKLNYINEYMLTLVRDFPRLASIETIGKSFEGRDMKLLKLTSDKSNGNSGRPVLWIDAAIHAREWITTTTALYIANELLTGNADGDRDSREILNYFDVYILPVSNPDGYEFTHTSDRMWRKNRSRGRNSRCVGVDPNRNFAFHWNEGGASSSPCSDIYAGSRPFSEPETRAVSGYIQRNRGKVKLYMALHSYGQMWLTPWGFTKELPPNYKSMVSMANRAVSSLESVYGTRYQVGSSTNLLYKAAGGADDWAHGMGGVPYSYTVELRDGGHYGFLLPRSQIVPTGKETFAGFKTLALSLADEFRRKARRVNDRSNSRSASQSGSRRARARIASTRSRGRTYTGN